MHVTLAVLSGRPPFFDALIPDRGLATLSAILSDRGISNDVFDLNRVDLSYGEFLKAVRKTRPDLVGFKFFDSGYIAADGLARLIRQEFPNTRIVAGGPHATLFQETIIQDTDAFDLLIAGDGERAILDIVDWVAGDRGLDAIEGAVFRTPLGGIRANPQGIVRDLDSMPFPAWSVYPLEKYLPIAMLSTYRGCPYTCAFCAHNRVWGYEEQGHRYRPILRQRSIASVEAETREATQQGLRLVGFTDSTPLPPMLREWSAGARRNGVLAWTSFAYVGHFSKGDFESFGNSGCAALWFGLESGNEHLRRIMGKNFTNAQVVDTFDWARQAKIVPIPGFIAGFPGDSPEAWCDTREFVRNLGGGPVVISPFILDPGSPVALDPERFGVTLIPDWQRRIVRRQGVNEFEIHTHSIGALTNVELWDSLRVTSGYQGYEADRNLAESEFAYLLERGTGWPAAEIVQDLDRSLKQLDASTLFKTLSRIWAKTHQGAAA